MTSWHPHHLDAAPRVPRAEPAGLAGDSHPLSGLGAAELLPEDPGGRPQGHHQAAVRGQHPQGRAVSRVKTLIKFEFARSNCNTGRSHCVAAKNAAMPGAAASMAAQCTVAGRGWGGAGGAGGAGAECAAAQGHANLQ